MTTLTQAVVPAGHLRSVPQPTLGCAEGDVVLRPWAPTHAADVATAFADHDIQRWHARCIESAAEAHAWIGQWASQWQAESAASWTVVSAEGVFLGQVGLRHIQLETGEAELSYWVVRRARNRGVATRSVRLLTSWAFRTAGLHRLSLTHSTRNHASCAVAAATGFALEGTLRQKGLHRDGWHDMHVHGLLSES